MQDTMKARLGVRRRVAAKLGQQVCSDVLHSICAIGRRSGASAARRGPDKHSCGLRTVLAAYFFRRRLVLLERGQHGTLGRLLVVRKTSCAVGFMWRARPRSAILTMPPYRLKAGSRLW